MSTATEAFPELPALKNLGDLAKAKPVIVVDTREQRPLVFTRLQSVSGALNCAALTGGPRHYFGPGSLSGTTASLDFVLDGFS